MFGRLIGGMRQSVGRGVSEHEVGPAAARDRVAAGSVLLDVREPEEWTSGHAPGARHIPLARLGQRLDELPTDREIITVCRSGRRSARAAAVLRDSGFTQVRTLAGGMDAWARAGLPIDRGGSGIGR